MKQELQFAMCQLRIEILEETVEAESYMLHIYQTI